MANRLDDILQEEELRNREFMRVFRPFPYQEPIFKHPASELIIRGGKRSGKSISASALFASRVTGQPIIAQDGTIIPNPWPVPTPEKPQIFWIIGWDTRHIGETIHRLLFQKGQGAGGDVRVIRDEKTLEWRMYNPVKDIERVHESRICEPLIPERFYDGTPEEAFTWEDKKSFQFKSVKLKNGATIYAYPSSSRNPKQGDAVSGIWIDEDIQFPGHLKEWQDRLTTKGGWFLWSVWPHMRNEALLKLLTRADLAEYDDEPQIKQFQLIMTDNPFISEKGKREALGRMDSDEEVARRNRGELLIDALSMYQFSVTANQLQRPIEGVMSHYEPPDAHQFLLKMYLERGSFPNEWTRYLTIDPSNTRTACHSWVVPPVYVNDVHLGNVAIAEWELIARRFTAEMLAKTLKDGWGAVQGMGGKNYEAFIMDMQMGRQTHAGRAENAHHVYAQAFKKYKLLSRVTNYSFLAGCAEPTTRHRSVRQLLLPQPENGLPSLMFVEERCVETRREFLSYVKKREKRGEEMDSVLDMPESPRLFDAMQSVEYFAAYIESAFLMDQAYVPPGMYVKKSSPVLDMVKKIKKTQQNEDDVVYFGGGGYDESSDVSAYY